MKKVLTKISFSARIIKSLSLKEQNGRKNEEFFQKISKIVLTNKKVCVKLFKLSRRGISKSDFENYIAKPAKVLVTQ